jgi:putative ABC transport system permease protein
MRSSIAALSRRCVISGLLMDVVHAVRALRSNPGYALSAMLCFALAMGVNTTLFGLLDSMYFRRLPVPDAGDIVQVHRERTPACTWSEYLSFRTQLRSMRAAAWFRFGSSAEIDGINRLLTIESVSGDYADVLRLGAALGQWFTLADDNPSREPGIVISYYLWKTRMHADPDVIGKSIRTDVQPFRVIGVAPEGFQGLAPPIVDDAWVAEASLLNVGAPANGLRVNLSGRLSHGSTLANARTEIRVIDARLRATESAPHGSVDPLQVDDASGFLWSAGRRYFKPVLLIMALVCGMVTLIACVNVANLLLARANSRCREMSVRRALGASRARLFQAAFVEALLLAAGGTILGIILGCWISRALELMLPSIPIAAYQGVRLGIDWRVALLLVAAGLLCAILFSVPPALANIHGDWSREWHGMAVTRSFRQRELYSTIQVALSVTLLIATGSLLRALGRAEGTDPGFAQDHRLCMDLLAAPDFKSKASTQVFDELLERARALPGIHDATLSSVFFGHEPRACASPSALEGPRKLSGGIVDPNYFEMMRVTMVRGRGFERHGSMEETPGVVVNETMARTWWAGEDALDKTLWLGCTPSQRKVGRIIGIARDSKYSALDEPAEPFYYVSRLDEPDTHFLALIVQTAGNPYQWARPLTDLVRGLNPRLRIGNVGSLEDSVDRSLWELKWQTALLGSLGVLAAILAALGLAGVMAYGVSQRTKEIGVRMALGACAGDVQRMVLARALHTTGIGLVAGFLLSAGGVRLLRNYLYGLSPFDPVAFAAVSLAWLAITVAASWYPAQRSTRIDPIAALKYE